MALKSNREGLRKELVDYLGNLIIDENLRNEIIKIAGNEFYGIDVTNIIATITDSNSYVATEDCYVFTSFGIQPNNVINVDINDISIARYLVVGSSSDGGNIYPLKKGQRVAVKGTSSWVSITVFGLKR